MELLRSSLQECLDGAHERLLIAAGEQFKLL